MSKLLANKKFEASAEMAEMLAQKGYKYVRPIGAGGSATCHLVFSEKYKTNFVCKEILLTVKQICSQCEINALKQLSSPNVIALYDVVVYPNVIYMFLEFCPQGSLKEIVEKQGKFEGKQLLGLCKNIITGLAYIHSEKFAHLDLKPANILVDRYGRPKLADFGISRLYIGRRESQQRAGTLAFMAPEIMTGRAYDPFKADIWSMGVTIYCLATGRIPWISTSVEALKRSITSGTVPFPREFPQELRTIISAMLRHRPEERPTAQQILQLKIFSTADAKDGFLSDLSSGKSQCRFSLNSQPEGMCCGAAGSKGPHRSASNPRYNLKVRLGMPVAKATTNVPCSCPLAGVVPTFSDVN